MFQCCNLCGKKSVVVKHLIHGSSRFGLCVVCHKQIQSLRDQDRYEAARVYLEEKMNLMRDDRMNFYLKNQIENAVPILLSNANKEKESEESMEESIPELVKSVGLLGGGLLFLLGVCILNIHLEMALAMIITAVFTGFVIYGIGIVMSLISSKWFL